MDDGDLTTVATRLGLSLEALEKEVRQTPGVHRSVDIIKDQLRSSQLNGRDVNRPQFDKSNSSHPQDVNLEQNHANRHNMDGLPPNQGQETARIAPAYIGSNLSTDPTDIAEIDWGFWDMAGGFQPDVYHWTVDDSFLQP